MDETLYEKAFGLIAIAGDSKSSSMIAIQKAKEGKFDEAEEALLSGQQQLNCAHDIQTDFLVQEANGIPVQMNIMLVHAQDHMTSAILTNEYAREFIEVRKELYELKQQLKKNKTKEESV